MSFKKYPEIENSYQKKFIDVFINEFPDIVNEKFIIEEKIHGSNIQFIIEYNSNKTIIFKRNDVLGSNENFFDLRNFAKTDEDVLKMLSVFKTYIRKQNKIKVINIFGEYFGKGIQKGVYYGEGKYYRIFDIMLNHKLITPVQKIDLLDELGLSYMNVPVLHIANSLEEALSFRNDLISKISEEEIEDNIMEGCVIKPYNKVIFNNGGSIFYLKSKNEKFKEKASKRKREKTKKELSEGDKRAIELNDEFKTFITKQRMDGIYSKYGVIKDKSQIQEYMKYFLEDAKKDFLKEFDVEGLDKNQLRKVFNVGSMVFELLKGEL